VVLRRLILCCETLALKDAMVVPIICHITAKGKALHKGPNNDEAAPNVAESTTAGDVDANHFSILVR
jgi:hypothetical protein